MTEPAVFAERLRRHRSVCAEILKVVEKENSLLRGKQAQEAFAFRAARKNLLAELSESLDKVRELRISWQKLPVGQRHGHPEVAELLRENQNLIMRILVLDRENEQTLLRQGLVPARQDAVSGAPSPKAEGQQKHFVASRYKRNAAT
jgi:hypothetical protein